MDTQPPMEHRWGRRIPCGSAVRISCGFGYEYRGHMRDVSMSGAFVETAAELPVGSQIAIAVIREDHEAALSGTVVRQVAGGIGVEWTEATPGAVCPVLGCHVPCAAAKREN